MRYGRLGAAAGGRAGRGAPAGAAAGAPAAAGAAAPPCVGKVARTTLIVLVVALRRVIKSAVMSTPGMKAST